MAAHTAADAAGAVAAWEARPHVPKYRVVARAVVRYRSLDTVTVLTGYVVLATCVPGNQVLPALGGVGTPANVYALLVLLWYLASWLVGRIVPAAGTRAPRVAMCAFGAAIVLSYIAAAMRSPTTLEVQAADRGLIQLAAWAGLVVAASAGIRDAAALDRLLRRLIIFGSIMAGIGLVEFFTRTSIASSVTIPGLQSSVAAIPLMDRSDFTRAMSTASHPLEFGGVMMMLLPFAIQQAFDPRRKGMLRKWVPVFLIGATAPATVSRTSVIGLIVVLALLVPTWSAQRRWPAVVVLIGSLGVIKVVSPGLIGTLTSLFSAVFNGGDTSTQARTGGYTGISEYFVERPWTGHGFGTFIPSLYRFTDNMYLLAAVELGVVGVLAILALGLTMLHCGGAGRRRHTDPAHRELGQAFIAAGAVVLVCGATFDTFSFPIFGGVYFLLLGCAGAYLGQARAHAGRAAPRPERSARRARNAALPAPPAPAAQTPPALDPAREKALGTRVASATRWSLLNTIVIRLGTFATGVVLARYLLGPSDWGLYAVGLVALTILLSANEMGVSLAMVRWQGDVRRFAPTVLTLSVASSLGLYGMFYFAAPTVARLLGSEQATPVLRVLCFAVVIDGLACVPNGYITREFRQVTRMVLDLLGFLLSTAVTIVLAVAGFGAMSFAWGTIAGGCVALTGAVIAAPGLMRFGWDRDQARALLRFGLPLAGASMLVLAMLSVDSAVVGAMLGPAALGLYQVAFNVSSWPVRIVSDAARRVSLAGFSRIAESRQALSDGFCLAVTVLLTAATPAAVVLGVLAEPVINLIYGSTWIAAAGALQFLAILGLLRVLFEAAYDCLVAAGRRRDLLAVQGLWLVALIPVLLWLAHRNGISGVGAGHVIVAALLVAPAFLVALSRAGIAPLAVARAAAPPIAGGTIAAAAALLVREWAGDGLFGLFAAGTAAMVAYAPILLRLRRILQRPDRTAADPAPETTGTEKSTEPERAPATVGG